MAAIPTVFAGVQFRSRLEARWAAFFELLRWPWDYEPIDLDGYIPDFVIRAPVPFLVEVKGSKDDVRAARLKIEASGWTGDALIVTDELRERYSGWGRHTVSLGTVRVRDTDDVRNWWEGSVALAYCAKCKARVPVGEGGGGDHFWDCRMCTPAFHARSTGTDPDEQNLTPNAEVITLWREAGNQVQWRSPRGSR